MPPGRIKNIKAHASEAVRVALIGNKADLRSCPDVGGVCTDPHLATVYAEKFGASYVMRRGVPTVAPPLDVAATHTCPLRVALPPPKNASFYLLSRPLPAPPPPGVPYFETSAKESTNVDVAFMSMVEGVINNIGPLFSAGAGAGAGRIHSTAAGIAAAGGAPLSRHPAPASSSGLPPPHPTDGRTTIGEKAGKLKKGMYETLRSAAGGGHSSSSKDSKSGASSFGPSFKGRSGGGHAGEDREKCSVS